ncbi:prevent-host-death family protein [Schaalia odontolytica]|uniref:prevent-host-death family protein n=1 Tax=Schaalia odontolytica TaxID=1660 RepID=UPI0028D36B1E|nr:prevent-host-death family protein [Schaalia odontolytica]
MVPSIFSRRPAPEPEATEVSSTSTHPTTLVGQARESWRSRLDQDIAADSVSLPTLSLSGAHPGGLAQLYTEHPVRLSLLIREPIALGRALDRARALIARSEQRANAHGTGPIHLGIGTASWGAGIDAVTVPALLRPVRLVRRDDDVLIALGRGATLAPELTDALHEHGVDVDGETVLAKASGTHGFSSSQAMSALRELSSALPRFDIHDELVIGLFCHPADALAASLRQDVTAFEDSAVIRALAGDQDACNDLRVDAHEPNPCDRDPWAEKGVGDLIPVQQDAVEAVSEGHSVFVDIPAHSDDASVVAAILADAAATGRSVLHVSTSPSRSIAAYTRLSDLGLTDVVANIDGYSDARKTLAARASAAMEDTSPVVDQARVDEMRARLRQVRSALSSYAVALHEPYGRFGVCAADALRALTDLTSGEDAPTTRVRLSEQALYDIAVDQGESARALLREAIASGTLSGASSSAWGNAVLTSDEQTSDVLLRVDRLSKSLPELRVHIASVAGEAGIKPAGTLAQWDRQLAMFDGIADVLDVFQPRVFERSAADMVIATAPKQWRKEHDISMGRSERNRLVKQAQDLVRPGVHVPDLHRALIRVQERRDAWCAVCGEDSWPILPAKIGEISALTDAVRDDLDAIAPVFVAEEADLVGTHLQRLTTLIERWAGDTSAAREVPARLAMHARLAERGLDKLAQDLAGRGVDDSAIDTELDLAWWASLLRAMLSSQPALGGVDPAALEELAREGRELDEEQVASLVPQAITGVRRIRTNALAARPSQYEELRSLLADGTQPSDLDLLVSYPLVRHLLPVLMTVPSMVPTLAPTGRTVDVVVLDGADGLSLAELTPIIARGHQLVVIDDLAAATEGGATRELAGVLPVLHVEPGPRRLNDQVALLLARYGYEHAGIPVPWTAANAPVSARWVEATGMPAPGAHAIESTAAEVRAVVDAVIEHAVESPERSLAVVALSDRHAGRIRDALETVRAEEPGLASFFDPATPEPFVVVGPSEAVGLTRESLIVSVGFAKTPHGRVIHDFGVLSTESGADTLAEILRAVRGDLTLVCALHSAQIDRERLGHEGSRMLVDLIEIAEGHAGEGMDAWPVLAGEPDRLLVDLAEHLYSRGLEVVANVGIPGGMRVPLAIGHPDSPGRLLLAVLTDDEEYLSEPSQRVRDRARPRWLEEQGWAVYTALSMALFIDPEKEASAIVDAVLDALDKLRAVEEEPVVVVPERVDDESVEERVEEAASQDGASDGAEDDSETLAAPRMPMLDDGLDEESKRRKKADEDTTGMLLAIKRKERGSEENRGPRPAIAKGLPLAAYSDDQLDEMAAWVRSDGVERTDLEAAEELREALGITRRGFQSDAVLGNVVRRTKPAGTVHTADRNDGEALAQASTIEQPADE